MTHRIQKVTARENQCVEAVFYGGEVVRYDLERVYAECPQFVMLREDPVLYEGVRVDAGGYGVSWNDELDLDAETIWEDGILIEVQEEPDINHLLAYQLLMARDKVGMTQKELAEKTGIYQADISKLERGIGNPSLSTLKRLADGMGMRVKIDFVYCGKGVAGDGGGKAL